MTRSNAIAWFIVLSFCTGLLLLGGCTSLESQWHGCDKPGAWRGWESQQICQRIFAEKIKKEGVNVHR